tara:strand:- start:528 stop:1907 length:1380 start_codon:yes stop_codon:yes gene_type:complete
MSDKDKFEEKLREKLESYQAPYNPSHWDSYRRLYQPNSWQSLLRLWYLPYLFSAILFGTLWFFGPFADKSEINSSAESTRVDTIYVQETIRIYDTLIIRDTVYIAAQASGSKQSPKSPTFLSTLSDQAPKVAPKMKDPENNATFSPTGRMKERLALRNSTPLAYAASSAQAKKDLDEKSGLLLARENATANSADSISTNGFESEREAPADTNKLTPSFRRASESLAEEAENEAYLVEAPSVLSSLWQSAGETLQAQDYRILMGPQLNIFSPWSYNNFSTYLGTFAGLGAMVGLNRLELHTGLHYGLMHNEYNSIAAISPSQIQNFPNYNGLNPSPDYIEIWTQQLHLPLQLSYITWQNDNWLLRSKAGVLGSILIREAFEYSYIDDNIDDIEDVNSSFRSKGLALTHANLGLSIAYSYQRKWQLEAALQYYHPLNAGMGISELQSSALALQIGYYWYLF